MEQTVSYMLAASAVGGFAVTAVTCWLLIPALHRLHFGQTIREEGPTWHNKKNGTPTMGGLGFIFGILVTLGVVWAMFQGAGAGGAGPAADGCRHDGAVPGFRVRPHRLSR